MSTQPQYMLIKTVKGVSKAFKTALFKTFDDIIFPYRMTRNEAIKILDLPTNYNQHDLEFKFSKFYSANSPKNKGSSYIQEKIKEARDLLSE